MVSVDVIAPAEDQAEHKPVGDWRPRRYTPTLSGTDDFTTAADGLLTLLVLIGWVTTEGPLQLDEWQVWLLRRALETYPPDWPVEHLRGRLRYKRVVISMGRQNGKSVIGALLAFFFLTRHVRGPKVGGFASIESQAKIVYDRVRFAVDHSPQLKQQLHATKTRGISHKDGTGLYQVYPAKEDSLQGEPFSAALYDELHLGDMALWDAIELAQRSKPQAMIAGLTTAGDDDSLLLKRLYVEGEAALDGNDERMGFFVWESITESFDRDYQPTEADVIAANPAIACGRILLADAMADVQRMWVAKADKNGVTGRDRVIRYTMNRFLEGTTDAWIPASQYNSRRVIDRPDLDGVPVYTLQRTAGSEHTAIVATWNTAGRLYSELVATINGPSTDDLEKACLDLATSTPGAVFATPSSSLKQLGLKLRRHGLDVWLLGVTEMSQAVATARGVVKTGTLTHDGAPLTRLQSGWAKTRNSDAGARLSETSSVGDIDAITATIAGIFVASHRDESTGQLF